MTLIFRFISYYAEELHFISPVSPLSDMLRATTSQHTRRLAHLRFYWLISPSYASACRFSRAAAASDISARHFDD